MNELHALVLCAVFAAITAALRFIPFLIFNGKKTPKFIIYLSHVLPFAIMGMLVVFCLKNVTILSYPYGIPELAACLIVAGLHLWKRNTLLSIVSGTVCYMLLVQLVF